MIRDKSRDDPAKPPKGVIAVAPPTFRRERALIKRGVWPVAGCDEAGRGPLAGPVVAAAVVLDPRRIPKGIDDSKRLTPERREQLFEEICATASFAVAFAPPARIDRDGLVLSIAAASIIAKVSRDRLMRKLAQDCPGYGFESHKGYGVPEHLEALDRLGPSVHHRRFFAPVIAARKKHHPEPVEADLFAMGTPVEAEVSAAI